MSIQDCKKLKPHILLAMNFILAGMCQSNIDKQVMV